MNTLTPSERSLVASRVGLHEQYVYQCLSGRRATPAERCPDLERASEGRLVCERLRPDVAWFRVADKSWRWHPKGRPLIDIVKSGR